MRERIFDWVMQFVPRFGSGRAFERLGNKFVPVRHGCAAVVADTASQHIEEEEAARHLPSAEVANAGAAPDMRGKFAFTIGNVFLQFLECVRWAHRIPARRVRRCIRSRVV